MPIDLKSSETSQKYVNDTESTLAALWAEVLQQVELPRPDDNFFQLGGDSMTMVQLESRMYEEFKIELPAGVVLSTPTLRHLADLLQTASVAPTYPEQ